MGLGLFSTRKIPRGDSVSYYIGEQIAVQSKTFEERVKAEKNFYMLGLGSEFVLDCYPSLEFCKASRCNSFKRAAVFGDKGWTPAVQNCELILDSINKIVKIRSISNIDRFTELFISYSKFYKFDQDL